MCIHRTARPSCRVKHVLPWERKEFVPCCLFHKLIFCLFLCLIHVIGHPWRSHDVDPLPLETVAFDAHSALAATTSNKTCIWVRVQSRVHPRVTKNDGEMNWSLPKDDNNLTRSLRSNRCGLPIPGSLRVVNRRLPKWPDEVSIHETCPKTGPALNKAPFEKFIFPPAHLPR